MTSLRIVPGLDICTKRYPKWFAKQKLLANSQNIENNPTFFSATIPVSQIQRPKKVYKTTGWLTLYRAGHKTQEVPEEHYVTQQFNLVEILRFTLNLRGRLEPGHVYLGAVDKALKVGRGQGGGLSSVTPCLWLINVFVILKQTSKWSECWDLPILRFLVPSSECILMCWLRARAWVNCLLHTKHLCTSPGCRCSLILCTPMCVFRLPEPRAETDLTKRGVRIPGYVYQLIRLRNLQIIKLEYLKVNSYPHQTML